MLQEFNKPSFWALFKHKLSTLSCNITGNRFCRVIYAEDISLDLCLAIFKDKQYKFTLWMETGTLYSSDNNDGVLAAPWQMWTNVRLTTGDAAAPASTSWAPAAVCVPRATAWPPTAGPASVCILLWLASPCHSPGMRSLFLHHNSGNTPPTGGFINGVVKRRHIPRGSNSHCVNVPAKNYVIKRQVHLHYLFLLGPSTDKNECLLRNGHGPCQDTCHNTAGGYYCTCHNLPGKDPLPSHFPSTSLILLMQCFIL